MTLSKGYEPRNYSAQPYGSVPYTKAFDLELIPRDEWKDRIDYLNEHKCSLMHLVERARERGEFKLNYQNGLPYCWNHGAVHALQVCRLKEGQPWVELSATAGAAKIKGFEERGGNTWDGIPFMAENGVPTVKHWPENEMKRANDNPETWKNAKQFKLDEWLELKSKDLDQKMTCLLNLIPVVSGYDWWGHMVCDLEATYRVSRGRTTFGVKGINSHGRKWGESKDGTYQLWGDKAISFDQAAPATTTQGGVS